MYKSHQHICIAVIISLILFAATGHAQSLTNITFVAFDLETTGFNARSGRVIEIGAVKFRNARLLESRSWLINPGLRIPESSQRIHGITKEMVAGSPPFREVFPEFAAFVEGAVLLAHNANFDIRFITAELARNNMSPPKNKVLDTLKLARAWFRNAGSYNLKGLVKHLGIPGYSSKTFHRALDDSRYVTAIFLAGLKKLPPGLSLNDLSRLAGGTLDFTRACSNSSQALKSEALSTKF